MTLAVRCRNNSLHVTERGSTTSNMDSYRMFVFLVIYLINKFDAQFTSEPGKVDGCLDRNVTLSWTITNYETIWFVTWRKGVSTIMTQNGQSVAISTVSNIKHGGNGAVVIVGVQSADAGEYSCDILYASGSSYLSTATLSILVPVAPSYPPRLESVVEENSIKHKCVLDTKGIPEADVTIMIGSDEKSSDTHSVPYGNIEDISCCVSVDAVTCLAESNVTKQCWKLKVSEVPGCILWKWCIAVMIISTLFPIVVIIALRICIFRKLSPSSECDWIAVTWRYLISCKGRTWLRVTIRAAVVAVMIDLAIICIVTYILYWCINCKNECTLDKCSDTWRECVLKACGCIDGILYIVIISITILCNKYLDVKDPTKEELKLDNIRPQPIERRRT